MLGRLARRTAVRHLPHYRQRLALQLELWYVRERTTGFLSAFSLTPEDDIPAALTRPSREDKMKLQSTLTMYQKLLQFLLGCRNITVRGEELPGTLPGKAADRRIYTVTPEMIEFVRQLVGELSYYQYTTSHHDEAVPSWIISSVAQVILPTEWANQQPFHSTVDPDSSLAILYYLNATAER